MLIFVICLLLELSSWYMITNNIKLHIVLQQVYVWFLPPENVYCKPHLFYCRFIIRVLQKYYLQLEKTQENYNSGGLQIMKLPVLMHDSVQVLDLASLYCQTKAARPWSSKILKHVLSCKHTSSHTEVMNLSALLNQGLAEEIFGTESHLLFHNFSWEAGTPSSLPHYEESRERTFSYTCLHFVM